MPRRLNRNKVVIIFVIFIIVGHASFSVLGDSSVATAAASNVTLIFVRGRTRWRSSPLIDLLFVFAVAAGYVDGATPPANNPPRIIKTLPVTMFKKKKVSHSEAVVVLCTQRREEKRTDRAVFLLSTFRESLAESQYFGEWPAG